MTYLKVETNETQKLQVKSGLVSWALL